MSLLDDLLSNPSGINYSLQQTPQGNALQQLVAPTQVQTQAPEQAVNDQPAPVNNPDPMVVTGSHPFQPVHRNFWGRLGDALAGHPIYEQRMRDRDLTAAMQGYDPSNPLPTIARIAKIPGMADDAYKMYDQVQTDQERDEARNVRNSAKMDMMWTRLGSMAAASNQNNYPAMREQMLRYIDTWNLPDAQAQRFKSAVPDTWDPDQLASLTEGAIKPGDQQKIAIQQQGVDVRKTAAQRLDDYRQSRLKQLGQQEQDRQGRFNATHPNAAAPGQSTVINTPYGPGIPGKSGRTLLVPHDGKYFGFVKVGINPDGSTRWHPVGEQPNPFQPKGK
jgi:hypothetical protein